MPFELLVQDLEGHIRIAVLRLFLAQVARLEDDAMPPRPSSSSSTNRSLTTQPETSGAESAADQRFGSLQVDDPVDRPEPVVPAFEPVELDQDGSPVGLPPPRERRRTLRLYGTGAGAAAGGGTRNWVLSEAPSAAAAARGSPLRSAKLGLVRLGRRRDAGGAAEDAVGVGGATSRRRGAIASVGKCESSERA